ncbi:hypothetical protein SDC9_102023 [bioreactor metagenome]|uniref:Uncharacterized protein n=1 Tax=bioreactor metagenome TaxID=1076179 RepID=A0A645AQ49_9ZZZZ|nr:hypothetical protein [Erysipelotrichaceae bacterium]
MKKYELNPKEELKFAVKPNVFDQERKKNRMLLLGVIAGAVVTAFFYYVMTSISSFYPLFLMMLLITGIGLVFYLIGLVKGIMGLTNEKYYITNVRIVAVNKADEITKELLISKIGHTISEKVTGKSFDIIINPKEETDPKKLRNHKGSKPLYTADTLILHAVNPDILKGYLNK